MKKIYIVLTLIILNCHVLVIGQTPLYEGKGRIIVSADGNEHDHDDWAGTALSLAVIAAMGFQDALTLYIYSDHIWGSNHEHPGVDGVSPYEQMKESAVTGGKMFGFKKTRFLCAVDDPEIAYESLKNEINSSTAEDPVFIVVSGPVHVIGEAINRAIPEKRRFVTLITMENCWNDFHADQPYEWWEKHSGWTVPELRNLYSSQGLQVISIKNQNQYLKQNWKEYDWLIKAPERNSKHYKKNSWRWLFNRMCMSIKPVSGEKNFYAMDPSDAGKVIFLLTGIEETSPELCYRIMRNPVK